MNDYDLLPDNHPEKLKFLMQTRATELFKLCDLENKGFINKKDIQRMREPLGLPPDELEEVFDSLDADQNGYLTLQEFTEGFSAYMGIPLNDDRTSENAKSFSDEQLIEEENLFRETMTSLGAAELIDSETNIKELWLKLRHEDPSMLRSFENFVENISLEIRRSKSDFTNLESALHSKSNVYDEHVRKLYEEMEAQIKAEKARILTEEKIKERELKEKLEKNLLEKEKQLQDSVVKQIDMEQKLFKLNLMEYQQKQENERLLKEKALLEEELQEKAKSLQESKTYINSLVQQTKEEKKNRAKQTLKVTENIAIERESLIKELDMLREINKKLQDERDELQLQNTTTQFKFSQEEKKTGKKPLRKQGSILSNYLRPSSLNIEHDENPFNPIHRVSVDDYSEDEAAYSVEHSRHLNSSKIKQVIHNQNELSNMQREQPIGANSVNNHSELTNIPASIAPQRVFKIVFIGDSGVGKTSFVQRFCNNSFRESFSTTIGVDFQVKSIMIDNRVIALQLWDTAGQERYRSITKQYFRKADGVICMYDITSEQSFKNLRNWITSMRESASDDCLLTIIGNKIDLCPNEESRVIKYKDGASIADEQGALFFETSSKESKYVLETMEAIARILQEKEDKQIEDVLNLRIKEKKKGCC